MQSGGVCGGETFLFKAFVDVGFKERALGFWGINTCNVCNSIGPFLCGLSQINIENIYRKKQVMSYKQGAVLYRRETNIAKKLLC